MARLLARKLLSVVPVLLAVSFLTYLFLNLLPGDPAIQILGPQNATESSIAAVREELRLDDPLPVRYVRWLGDAVTGDLGRSYKTNQEVSAAIGERLPVTLQLVVMALVLSAAIAVPLGVLSAYKAQSRFDRAVTSVTFGLLSVPSFMAAILLIFLVAVRWEALPATSWGYLSEGLGENLRHSILPTVALAVPSIAVFTRLLRTDMIATLQEDHVMLARAKGLPTGRILFRHALRPSSFSLLTVAGITFGNLIGGAVVIEQIFALPGLGRLLFDSILQRDFLLVQGVVLFITAAFVLVNVIVDLLYSALDPRIRQGGARAHA